MADRLFLFLFPSAALVQRAFKLQLANIHLHSPEHRAGLDLESRLNSSARSLFAASGAFTSAAGARLFDCSH